MIECGVIECVTYSVVAFRSAHADIPRNVVAAALQMLVGIVGGYFHAAGRRITFPVFPTGTSSGNWQMEGRSREKEMWECESMEMVGWWNEKMVE